MDKKSKQALIERIKNNSLSEIEKEQLITLLNKNDLDGFLKYFFSICRLGGDILRFFDLGD
jgi:hypothetical protein